MTQGYRLELSLNRIKQATASVRMAVIEQELNAAYKAGYAAGERTEAMYPRSQDKTGT